MAAVCDDLSRYAGALRGRLGEVFRAGRGVRFRCPFHARHKHGDANPSCCAWVSPAGRLCLRCKGCGAGFAELCDALGLDPRDCFPDGRRTRMGDPGPKPTLTATYQYRDRDGRLRYEKQRWEPGWHGERKTFVARRPLPDDWRRRLNCPAGQDAWVYGLAADEYCRPANEPNTWEFRRLAVKAGKRRHAITLDACEPLLYRLPELAAADARMPVFVVEGEDDVECLRSLGFVATCGHAGANTWLPEWAWEFRGRRVVVIPDHNGVGYQHADRVAGSVVRAGAASVRVVQWDDEDAALHPGEGGGVKNWLAGAMAGATDPKAAVVELVKGSVEFAGTPVHKAGRATGTEE